MKNTYYILIAVFGFVVDRILKYAFARSARFSGAFFVNDRFAWGLPISNTATAIAMIMIVIALVIFVFKYKHSALLVIIAGAGSNLFDRIAYGGVIDYIHTPFGGVINIADVMIGAGALILILHSKKVSDTGRKVSDTFSDTSKKQKYN